VTVEHHPVLEVGVGQLPGVDGFGGVAAEDLAAAAVQRGGFLRQREYRSALRLQPQLLGSGLAVVSLPIGGSQLRRENASGLAHHYSVLQAQLPGGM